MNYYVIQEISGSQYIHGPYRSEEARDNRYDKVEGGEVHKFNSFSGSSEEVRQEFLDERVKKL